MPVNKLTYGAAGSGNFEAGSIEEARMNWLPNTTWYSQNRTTNAAPIVTMAAFIPMVWLRCVSFTSPVNDMDSTANHSEKAGQSAKKAVSLRLKCGLRLSPAFFAACRTC